MKPKIDPNSIPELVSAAQIAGADESQEFWRQVAAHTGARESAKAELVSPRPLKSSTTY